MPDEDFELVTNPNQFSDEIELRKKVVDLPAVKKRNGKLARVVVSELDAGSASRYDDSLRRYDENGRYTGQDYRDSDMKLLAQVVHADKQGNKLWPTVEAALETLRRWGTSSINLLMAASQEVNSGPDGKPVSDEDLAKNSETAQTSS